MNSACHVPEITVTEYLQVPADPRILHEKPRGTAKDDNWLQIEVGSTVSDDSLNERTKISSLSIQKYGSFGNGQLLVPDNKYGASDSESSPLLSRSRKISSGYRDKKFDDDVSIASSFYPEENSMSKYWNVAKIAILAGFTIACVIIYTVVAEQDLDVHQYAIESGHDVNVSLSKHLTEKRPLLHLSLIGPFFLGEPDNDNNNLHISLHFKLCNGTDLIADTRNLKVSTPTKVSQNVEDSRVNIMFDVKRGTETCNMYLQLSTNYAYSFPFVVNINEVSTGLQYGVIYAALILVGLYLLIIFEVVHRTLAAMLAATAAISVLSAISEKPSLQKIMNWIDIETLCLLFGMMVMVSIVCETGFFDYLAVFVFKIARGRIWPLLTLLCFATAFISAFLDNVTTILLLTPVTIRLSEVLNLNPKYVLIALVIFSNVGGTATAVGDPPNVIIVSNPEIKSHGIEFTNFTTHMGLGVIFILFFTYGSVMIMYRYCIKLSLEDQPEVVEMKQEIQVWKRAAKSLSLYSRDEASVRRRLMRKVATLENNLKKRLYSNRPNEDVYKASLIELEERYKIRDWPLLIKSGFVLFCVIVMFFLHSIVPGINISLGWIALMGAILLLVLADMSDVEHLFSWIEWSTLIFFAALFVVMEALTEMGLLEAIGSATENFINGIDQGARLPVAIILVLWVSAIASSFIDNIPFTTVMLQIVLRLGQNPELQLPLQPLVWSLAFGACLGGNGTLIGASANVVCAGVAEQHGYKFTFLDFFKIGFPIMLLTTLISMCYLLVCHVLIGWNS